MHLRHNMWAMVDLCWTIHSICICVALQCFIALNFYHCFVCPDVYSYDEDDMVLDAKLPEHLSHFGIDMMTMEKVSSVFWLLLAKAVIFCSLTLKNTKSAILATGLVRLSLGQVPVDKGIVQLLSSRLKSYGFSQRYWNFFHIGRHPDSYGWLFIVEQLLITWSKFKLQS